jgi:GntR family transcriptional regulator
MALAQISPNNKSVPAPTGYPTVSPSAWLDQLRISRASSVPIYHQIKEQIVEAIVEGILVEGDPLPSERDLVERLNVSRMTIRRALNELVLSGQLRTWPGKGTFVRAAKVEQHLGRLAGFSADMIKAGHRVASEVLRAEVTPVGGKIAQHLRVGMNDAIIVLERRRLVDGEPTSWERAYLPERLCPGLLDFDLERRSLYDVLRREYHIALKWARQRMEATLANWHEQQLLEIPEGVPILLGERTVYTDDDTIVEYSKASYRGDRYRYEVEIMGDQPNERT